MFRSGLFRRLLVGAAVVVCLAFGAAVVWMAMQLPAVNRLARGVGQTVFYGADGKPWFSLSPHHRDVTLDRIAPDLQHAVVAIEDHRFLLHPGIDPIAVGRAALTNLKALDIVEGGSTLTQQLARTIFLSNSRTYGRKIREILLAVLIDARLSKPRILELYLNRIYLGGNVYGVEAMSQNVFGKSAADLSLGESAFIAGLIRAPSDLSPWAHYDRALVRSRVVLARMRAERLITPEAERAALVLRPRILDRPGLTAGASGYAADFLREQFRQQFGNDDPPDWKVQTSIVPDVQAAAERAVVSGLQRLGVPGLQAALVAIDPNTGDVLALVGGRDYGRSPFNRATAARRQPGSAFKPFVYAAALDQGESPVSVLSGLTDLKVAGQEEWVVRNASTNGPDALTLREALTESDNRAAVRMQDQIGSRAVLRLAQAVGLDRMPDVPSLALGTGEVTPLALTTAYATFVNGGYAVAPRAMLSVTDRSGVSAFEQPVARRPVLSAGAAFQMVSMLQDVVDRGTGSPVRALGVRFPVAGKTGTTDDFKDAWFVGFSSSTVVGVWVGLDQPRSIAANGFGSRYALPIWADFMTRIVRMRPAKAFSPPSAVEETALCRETHLLATRNCPVYAEYFKSGDMVPDEECDVHSDSPLRRAGAVMGTIVKEIGRGLGRIFGR